THSFLIGSQSNPNGVQSLSETQVSGGGVESIGIVESGAPPSDGTLDAPPVTVEPLAPLPAPAPFPAFPPHSAGAPWQAPPIAAVGPPGPELPPVEASRSLSVPPPSTVRPHPAVASSVKAMFVIRLLMRPPSVPGALGDGALGARYTVPPQGLPMP